ncbi:MAG: hypothetical protein R3A47_08570 [Polyangiales bacterium]
MNAGLCTVCIDDATDDNTDTGCGGDTPMCDTSGSTPVCIEAQTNATSGGIAGGSLGCSVQHQGHTPNTVWMLLLGFVATLGVRASRARRRGR